jgi:hypothetical protein
MCDPLQLLAAILAQWQHPVTFINALDLLHWGMHAVSYRRTAAAIKKASKVGPFFIVILFAVALAANTEQVVAQWQCPVASGVALHMLHWAMPSVLLQRTAVAIKMAGR